ncbi:MAG: trypsin-like serine protease [Hyphomicrobiaceae bacterium]
MTAAHCVVGYSKDASGDFQPDGRRLELVFGVDNLHRATPASIGLPEAIVRHDAYKEEEDGEKFGIRADIALIKLRSKMRPQKLFATIAETRDPGEFLTTAGFGATVGLSDVKQFSRASDGRTFWAYSATLKQASVSSAPLEHCHKIWGFVDERHICAGLPFSGFDDSCNGDSGGPLMKIDFESRCPQLVGIVSWGARNCGNSLKPGVYTRVSSYIEWIRQHTALPIVLAGSKAIPFSARQKELLKALDEALVDVSQRINIRIEKLGGKSTVGVGTETLDFTKSGESTKFGLRVESTVSGRLVLIDLKPDGQIRQVLPNGFSASGANVEASKPLFLPEYDKHGFDAFEAEPIPGAGRVLAIIVPPIYPYELLMRGAKSLSGAVSDRGVKFDGASGVAYLTHLVDHIQRTMAARPATRGGDWGYGYVDYKQVSR